MTNTNQFLSLMSQNRMFSTDELAMATGLSFSGVHQICRKLGLQQIEINPKKFRWDYASYLKLKAYVDTHKAIKAKVAKVAKEELADLKKNHPLVKDERCFNLSWFPDSGPEIFRIWGV